MKSFAIVCALVCVVGSCSGKAVGSNAVSLNSVSSVEKRFSNKADFSLSAAAAVKGAVAAPAVDEKLKETLKLVGLFTLWYGFNAAYNVFNAFVKKDFQFPITTAALQLLTGMVYAVPLWALKARKIPNLNKDDLLKLLPIACLNALGHAVAVIAMFEKGGGSFTHVIKASEPVVSVILGFFINKVVPKPLTALSLLPITYGVAYASTLGKLDVSTMSTELTTKAAKMAMCSNVAFSLRSILRKNTMTAAFKARTNLDPSNEHAVTTLLSFLLTVPFALAFENTKSISNTFSALSKVGSLNPFLFNLFICGMAFYLYNDMQNIVLGSLGPVPTAVGNTLKRVVIFVALYLFTKGETFPQPKIIGCAIAIAGCLGFAIFDSKKM